MNISHLSGHKLVDAEPLEPLIPVGFHRRPDAVERQAGCRADIDVSGSARTHELSPVLQATKARRDNK